jgi:hypothetical protein
MLSQFEEGNTAVRDGQTVTTLPYEEDIIHSDLISDPITEDKEVSSEEEDKKLQCQDLPEPGILLSS